MMKLSEKDEIQASRHETGTIKTTINGRSFEFTAKAEESAIEVIREQAQLTGAKLVCGAGVCGACTILVDGLPVTSCLLPAHALEGKNIQTIEAHPPDRLHPAQKAFMAHDGLQCGFCTPGFINEAIAFYDQWRTEYGKSSPSREQVAAAMSGHLCRCGAYAGIFQAIQSACAGDFDEAGEVVSPRVEAIEKVTGRAKYTVDIHYADMLFGKFLGSPHAHARLISIDTSKAEKIPGVIAIIEVLEDAHRVARFVGQPILAIAAVNEETAHEAINRIEIQYEVRPFVSTMKEALAADAPEVYPESKKNPPNASEGPIPPGSWTGNLRKPYVNWILSSGKGKAEKRAVNARSAEALQLVERTYRTPGQTHTSLEPHSAVAKWDGEDKVTVHASTQTVGKLAKEIARHYKLKKKNVKVISEYIGGAFGSKQGFTIEIKAALELSRKAGAPVKIAYDRQEELVLGGYRPLTRTELELVATQEGEARAMTAKAYGTCGIAVQSQVAPWLSYTYGGMAKSMQDFDVVTNAAGAKPFRAPSGPAAFWALESAVDEMAHHTGVDPIELRRKWEDSDVRDPLYDWAAGIPEWQSRGAVNSGTGRYKKGIGLAIGNWFNIYDSATKIELSASAEGLVARTAIQDMGNGCRSVIAKAVAEEMGISPLAVAVEIGHSEFVYGPDSSGSRMTNSVYSTSVEAAKKLKEKLLAGARANPQMQNIRWENGGIAYDGGHLPLAGILREIPAVSVTSTRGSNSTFDLLGKMPSAGLGVNLYPKMTGAVYLAAVTVDTRLAKIKVDKVWAGLSVGKIVNPELARSQVYGGIIQHIGYALYEERLVDPTTATVLTYGLEDYQIPGIGDMPEIDVFFNEKGFEGLKGGASGLSELCTLPVAPAIGNAVFHATGWRPTEIPMRPNRVIEGLRRMG